MSDAGVGVAAEGGADGGGGGGGGGDAARLQLPSLTAEESASIQYYLDECGVSVGDIHELEGTLRQRLDVLERDTTRALFGAELAAGGGSVLRELQRVHERVLRMSKWMRHHDRGLHNMKVGIAAIEGRNRLLDLQEKNHGILADTLQHLLSELTMDSSTMHTLLNPRIAESRAAYKDVLRAARLLHAKIHAHLHNGLDALAAVREKRHEMHQIRETFCDHLFKFFTSEFAAAAERTSKKKRSTAQALVSHERAHMFLGRFEELAAVLEMLSPDVFVALRRHYSSAFHVVYKEQFHGYFSSLKKTMSREKKECNLSAPTEEEILPDRSLSSRSGRAFLKRAAGRGTERDEDSSISVHGNQLLVTEAFKDIIDNAVLVVMEEQDFCLSFFGFRQLESLKTDNCPVVEESQLEAENHKQICALLGALFKGFEADIRLLCDKAADLSSAYLVEIIVRIEVSLNEYPSDYSPFIHSMLESLRSHVSDLFQRFVKEQIDWISSLKPNPKRCGVLLPIRRFPQWVERLLRAAARAAAPSSASTASSSAALTSLESVFVQVTDALMSWLQNVAKQDSKYTHVVLMENAYHFWSVMSTSSCSKGAGMAAMVAKAYEVYVDARDSYVQWNIGYALPEIMEFFDLLETQMKACTNPTDVPFMQGLSKHELRALLKAHLQHKKLKKRAQTILNRIQKHIGPSSSLLPTVWRCVRDSFVERFQQFEELVSKCYHTEQVGMTVAELDSVFIRLSNSPEETSYTESSRASLTQSPRR